MPVSEATAALLHTCRQRTGASALSFEECIALLVDHEVHARNDHKLLWLLKNAYLQYGQAAIEDIDGRAGRGIDRREVLRQKLLAIACLGRILFVPDHF